MVKLRLYEIDAAKAEIIGQINTFNKKIKVSKSDIKTYLVKHNHPIYKQFLSNLKREKRLVKKLNILREESRTLRTGINKEFFFDVSMYIPNLSYQTVIEDGIIGLIKKEKGFISYKPSSIKNKIILSSHIELNKIVDEILKEIFKNKGI